MTTLLDSTIRRDAQLLRFGTYLKSEYITPSMQKLARDIPKLLVNFEDLNKLEQRALVKEINALIQAQIGGMFDAITNELHDMTAAESEFIFDLYDDFTEANFATVAQAAVIKAADSAILSLEKGKGKTVGLWSELAQENINGVMREIDAIVRDGFRGGTTLQQMTQSIRGTYNRSAKAYRGGILDTTTSRAEALARTGVSHYSNRARDSFAEKNKRLLPESVFFATLDNRVTLICASLHLNRYKNDDPKKPVLPLHYGERSVYLFAGDGIDPLEGTRPIVGGKDSKAAREAYEKEEARLARLRASRAEKRAEGELTPETASQVRRKGNKIDIFNVEQVSAKVTSQQWLKRQPRWFIEDTLGKERARLFLDGGLDIKKFTDITGRPLTLAELKETAAGERTYRRLGA